MDFSYLLCGFVVVFALVFNDGMRSGAGSGFFILFILAIPIPTFVAALILYTTNVCFKWLYPFLFGILGLLVLMSVFSTNYIVLNLLISILPPFLGAGSGWLLRKEMED